MAAPKLTAQQKRDRDQAALLAELQRKWELDTAKSNDQHYALGRKEAAYETEYLFSRMNLWQRITYPATFRKSL